MPNQHRKFYRRALVLLVFFSAILVLCVIGCNQDARYKVLTFFFEGVPKPGEENPRSRWNVNRGNVSAVQGTESGQENELALVRGKSGQKRSSRHGFSRDCAKCHTGGLTSGQQDLRTPLPELCYSCHADLYQESDYIHGPLNVGECVFCHDPHQSAYIHLQKAPQPDLCYRCHQRDDIAMIPGHDLALESICTDCHEPHGSPNPKLLKTVRTGRERMKELLNLEVKGDVINPKLESPAALEGFELSSDDPNIVN